MNRMFGRRPACGCAGSSDGGAGAHAPGSIPRPATTPPANTPAADLRKKSRLSIMSVVLGARLAHVAQITTYGGARARSPAIRKNSWEDGRRTDRAVPGKQDACRTELASGGGLLARCYWRGS